MPGECRLSSIDLLQIAWAAGFFDGEGSTIAYFPNKKKSRYLRLQASVPQTGHGGVPEVLFRFRAAMLGMGKIVGPDDDGVYLWRTRGFEETQAAVALLWPYLGPVKRGQAAGAIREVLDGYRSGLLKARPDRRSSRKHVIHAAAGPATASPDDLERAWAAGFLDGEGCFGTYHSTPRKRAPAWYRIRASAAQHGEVGVPAEVLVRLQRALGGLGRIERHGDPDDFRWLAEGTEAVEHVLARTRSWLGTVKTEQAYLALQRFRAQIRLRGSATHCVRGHEYSGTSMRGGRLRKICRPCDRINARLQRAAAGVAPRQFRNEARRYTF